MILPDLQSRTPYVWLIFGSGLLLLAIIGTRTGKVRASAGGVADRTKEPQDFWGLIIMYYLCGICSIGYFLYEVYGFPD